MTLTRFTTPRRLVPAAAAVMLLSTITSALAQSAPSSSLLANPSEITIDAESREEVHALRQMSLFAIAPPQPREFREHDLIQIIVREQSQATSRAELETEKTYEMQGQVSRWPAFDLAQLLQLRIDAGRTTGMPELDLGFEKTFEGEGDYRREDDLAARITAEIIQVLPNGNLVLEARTQIKTDREVSTMKVTGVCRPDDITVANTILSNQIHNLVIDKVHSGELRKATEKGIIARALDAVFAF